MADQKRHPLFSRTLKALAQFLSKDGTRPILGAVHITPTKVIATDSYKLAVITYDTGTNPENFPKIGDRTVTAELSPVNINGKQFLKALADIPAVRRKKSRTGRLTGILPILGYAAVVGSDESSVHIATTDLDQSTVRMVKRVEGTFPDYTKLLPDSDDEPAATIAFNVGFLAEVAKAFKDFGADLVEVELRGAMKPGYFKATNKLDQTMEVILMPVRLG